MVGIIGVICVFVTVFGGYLLAGGHLDIILHSLPYEMLMICGAAIGAFIISNNASAIKHTMKDVGKVFKGPQWGASDYRDLLCLLYELLRIAKTSPVALDPHIEDPQESSVFQKYPRILKDKESVALITDTLRSAMMNYDDPHQVEEVLTKRIEATHHHKLHSTHALQTIADGLPALGIVAAVLGVIKTMGSIDKPPEVLGKLIGGALVGTFLGVFLAYGFVGPFSSKVKSVIDEDANFHILIKEVLVAHLHAHPPKISVEVGRQNIPAHLRPDFSAVEEALKSTGKIAA